MLYYFAMLFSLCALGQDTAHNKPNVLFISIDDQNDDIVTWVSPLDKIQMTRLLNLSDSLKIPIINVMNIDYVDTRNRQSFNKKLNKFVDK